MFKNKAAAKKQLEIERLETEFAAFTKDAKKTQAALNAKVTECETKHSALIEESKAMQAALNARVKECETEQAALKAKVKESETTADKLRLGAEDFKLLKSLRSEETELQQMVTAKMEVTHKLRVAEDEICKLKGQGAKIRQYDEGIMQTRIQILEAIEGLKLQTLRNLDAYKEAWMALPSNDPAAKELQDGFWEEIFGRRPTDHVEAQLAPILREFDLLSKCVEDINGTDVRKLENNVLETPLDEPIQGQLLAKTDTMGERYVQRINSKVCAKGRTKLWIQVCRAATILSVRFTTLFGTRPLQMAKRMIFRIIWS